MRIQASWFFTIASILIASDFIMLQIWFSFETYNPDNEVGMSFYVGAIMVFMIVMLTLAAIIMAIFRYSKINNRIGNRVANWEIGGAPILFLLFSLFFTAIFIYQAIVSHTIKNIFGMVYSCPSIEDDIVKILLCVFIVIYILVALMVTNNEEYIINKIKKLSKKIWLLFTITIMLLIIVFLLWFNGAYIHTLVALLLSFLIIQLLFYLPILK